MQAPAAEWATIRAFAVELLAFAEAEAQGTTVAVVPASVLKELSAAPVLAVAGRERE